MQGCIHRRIHLGLCRGERRHELGIHQFLETHVVLGKEIDLKILELNRREKNLVVSHKEFLKEIEAAKLAEVFETFEVGQLIEGEIKSIVDFGIFVDIGGFEGLVHRTEISWKDLPAPPSEYKVGGKVNVKILDLDREKKRISLSIKQSRPDP